MELKLLVCNLLERTFAWLPPLPTTGHKVSWYNVNSGEGAEFRVVVVIFGVASPNFYVLVYSSASSACEVATGALKLPLVSHKGPAVVVGDVVYRLECEANKCVMAVNRAKMTLSALPLPNTGILLYTDNNWIGKTEDGCICFFVIREPLLLVKWVLQAPGSGRHKSRWRCSRALMDPATVGDLHGMKLSARIAYRMHGCNKLVSFGGSCGATGSLGHCSSSCLTGTHGGLASPQDVEDMAQRR